jgi:hypothetical protein
MLDEMYYSRKYKVNFTTMCIHTELSWIEDVSFRDKQSAFSNNLEKIPLFRLTSWFDAMWTADHHWQEALWTAMEQECTCRD